jgi:O-antigen ligase
MMPLGVPGSPAPTQQQYDVSNPLRRVTFFLVLIFVFLRVSVIHELLSTKLGFNSYLLLLFGLPAVVGVILTGAIRRTLQSRAGRYWLAFYVWMVVTIPFSVWKGGSIGLVGTYGRTELCVLFMLAGIPVLWSECRYVLYALALGSFVCVLVGRFFMVSDYGGERMSLAFGSIANSNDFAAHLLFALPFLLFVILSPKTTKIFRIVSGLALIYGLFLVLGTASRGALVALGGVALYVFWRGSMPLRISMLVGLPAVALLAVAVLPGAVLARLETFTTSSTGAASVEAADSARVRRYEFDTSVRYTLQHPLFGVGPGQFSTYEGESEKTIGVHGTWLQTHNVLTQISSECGIPALLFFLAAIGSTFLLIHRVQKRARLYGLREISMAAYCLGVALVGFFAADLFLNLAYRFYFPAMTGLAIALYSSVEQEISAFKPVSVAAPAPAVPRGSAPVPAAQVPATPAASSRRYRFGRLR